MLTYDVTLVCEVIEATYNVVGSVISIMNTVSYIFPQETVTLEIVLYTYIYFAINQLMYCKVSCSRDNHDGVSRLNKHSASYILCLLIRPLCNKMHFTQCIKRAQYLLLILPYHAHPFLLTLRSFIVCRIHTMASL